MVYKSWKGAGDSRYDILLGVLMNEPHGEGYRGLFEGHMKQLSLGIRGEKKIMSFLFSYALAVSFFSLISPLTVQ